MVSRISSVNSVILPVTPNCWRCKFIYPNSKETMPSSFYDDGHNYPNESPTWPSKTTTWTAGSSNISYQLTTDRISEYVILKYSSHVQCCPTRHLVIHPFNDPSSKNTNTTFTSGGMTKGLRKGVCICIFMYIFGFGFMCIFGFGRLKQNIYIICSSLQTNPWHIAFHLHVFSQDT